MAATEEALKNLITECELITISEQNVLDNLKKPEINQYIITGDKIFFWSPQLDKPKKIDLLPKKSWETFKQTLNLDKSRKATRADFDTIKSFTGHPPLAIDELPLEMIAEIAKRLPDEKTRSQFTLTCRFFYDSTQSDRLFAKLLQHVLDNKQDKAELILNEHPELLLRKLNGHHVHAKLLTYVLSGDQDKAEWILKRYPELLLRKTDFTDPWTKESFKDKSVFQYAKWVKDTRMYTMMLDCLPQNEQGEDIRKDLLEQANVQTEHFDFTPLITALRTHVNNFKAWDLSQQQAHWCGVLGVAQQNLPAHVRHEYCEPNRSFYAVPSFTEKVFKRSLEFYHEALHKLLIWDVGLLGLGTDFAMSRQGMASGFLCGEHVGFGPTCAFDLAAITTLCEVRTADLSALMQRLQTPMKKLEDDLDAPTRMIS